MQHTIENLSTLRKKITVSISVMDVNDVLDKLSAKYRNSVSIAGFRKGKAPLKMVEKQYARDILSEATSQLVDNNVQLIISQESFELSSGIEYDVQDIVARDKDLSFSFSFDVMPEIKLPNYKGLAVKEEEVNIDDSEVEKVIESARNDLAELVDIDGRDTVKDGDVVTMNFIAYDEEGKELPGMRAENMQMPIGMQQALEDLEALVKKAKLNTDSEGEVTFPADFPSAELAGKKVTMKFKVTKIQTRKLPELNDEFAKKLGQYESLDKVREVIKESFTKSRKEMNVVTAKNILVQELLAQTDFPLPEGMFNRYATFVENDLTRREMSKNQGKEIADLTKIKAEAKKEAEEYVRSFIFLSRVAKEENITVSEEEILAHLQQIAVRNRRSFEEVRDEYVKNNLIGSVHDNLLAEKALDHIYSQAKIEYVKPEAIEKAEKKPATKKPATKKETVKIETDKNSPTDKAE